MAQAVTQRLEEQWDWLAAALFLLLTVDMLTTLGAAHAVGVQGEVNPLVQHALLQGVWALVALNLAALVVAAVAFHLIARRVENTAEPFDRYVAYAVEVWLGVLVAIGLAIFANNFAVIVLGESLL